jgi:hypothetical protein
MPLRRLPPHTDTRAHQVLSVPPQTPTRTGLRSRISLSAGEYRTVSLSATTVRSRDCSYSHRSEAHTDFVSGKKLKKRLEDLERRAASSSASPEQRPAELQPPMRSPRQDFPSPASSESDYNRRTPETPSHHYIPPSEERGMFSHQYTRQLSTSPPPFSYSTYPAPDTAAYSVPYAATHAPYHSIPTTASEMPGYGTYLPPISSAYPTTLPSLIHSVKAEYYPDNEISPFGVGYASMAGIEIPPSHQYPEDPNVKHPPRKPYYAR